MEEQDILKELGAQIDAELHLVNKEDYPSVYEMAQSEPGRVQLHLNIIPRVLGGQSIGEAIAAIETENNPNRIE